MQNQTRGWKNIACPWMHLTLPLLLLNSQHSAVFIYLFVRCSTDKHLHEFSATSFLPGTYFVLTYQHAPWKFDFAIHDLPVYTFLSIFSMSFVKIKYLLLPASCPTKRSHWMPTRSARYYNIVLPFSWSVQNHAIYVWIIQVLVHVFFLLKIE